jgi:hypothetical protein
MCQRRDRIFTCLKARSVSLSAEGRLACFAMNRHPSEVTAYLGSTLEGSAPQVKVAEVDDEDSTNCTKFRLTASCSPSFTEEEDMCKPRGGRYYAEENDEEKVNRDI